MLATMPALQYRHEAPPQLVAEAPHLVVHTGGGYYPCLASTFPAPRLCPSRVYCLLLRTKALSVNWRLSILIESLLQIELQQFD